MSRYFWIGTGLRGCYLPDNSFVVKVDTRRELKKIIEYDARDMKEAYGFGGSKRAIAKFAAECWRERNFKLPYCLPFGRKPNDYAFGLFCSVSTRQEYLEYQETEMEN